MMAQDAYSQHRQLRDTHVYLSAIMKQNFMFWFNFNALNFIFDIFQQEY
jgi:hypothetical protein